MILVFVTKNLLIPPDAEKYVEGGYQGLQKLTKNVFLPYKRKKSQPLTDQRKYLIKG